MDTSLCPVLMHALLETLSPAKKDDEVEEGCFDSTMHNLLGTLSPGKRDGDDVDASTMDTSLCPVLVHGVLWIFSPTAPNAQPDSPPALLVVDVNLVFLNSRCMCCTCALSV